MITRMVEHLGVRPHSDGTNLRSDRRLSVEVHGLRSFCNTSELDPSYRRNGGNSINQKEYKAHKEVGAVAEVVMGWTPPDGICVPR